MGFSCGIVGMPNVGKSTLFNAVTNAANAQTANYPFCTIEPNQTSVAVPDKRLHQLAKIASSVKVIPTFIDFVDIAGLIKNASKGEGLGNQFLEHIRSVDAIMHVVRCFEDNDIIHTENSVDPVRDAEIVETELLLSDISFIEKRLLNLTKKSAGCKIATLEEIELCKKMLDFAQSGQLLRLLELSDKEKITVYKMHLLTMKPIIYIANIDESSAASNVMLKKFKNFADNAKCKVVPICAKIESEMIGFKQHEKIDMIKEMGFGDTALNNIVKYGHNALNLITFFTVGEKETRAWSMLKGELAPSAAGVIHTDFKDGFIKAETISFNDFIEHQGHNNAKNAGKLRFEGKGYIVQEGDIMHFRFNV
ncbi:MAG: redox-regulated ATPase YchF [Alphaproteobacteria bacterium]|nr:redox-regulated ATPase YchF [Rickettsiales bacterium]